MPFFFFFFVQASGVAVCADLQIMAEPENGKVRARIFVHMLHTHVCTRIWASGILFRPLELSRACIMMRRDERPSPSLSYVIYLRLNFFCSLSGVKPVKLAAIHCHN